MTAELDALIKKRLKWVEANRENGFDEGINRLLTELYPDNAHFIYELLQNAEDPQATEVAFHLSSSAIKFEHNGKRLFTIKDVGSITSIGNSTKRDDPTTIGKFGVGFKAVFAYTNTPEIHSGNFHFRIHDLVVPETIKNNDNNSDQKTRFNFPFDNLKKPPETAVKEIETGLRNLGDNTLLFLSHIRKIEYKLPGGSTGSLQRIDHVGGHIEIHAKHPGGEETVSHWLHFQKTVDVTDDDGKSKSVIVAIAYSLVEEPNKKTEESTWKIVPLQHGQVSIFFPAEKEASNLRFHIHAPFASTVARDSVRDCKANHQLRDRIAELVVESLTSIRDQGMLTVSFLAVLPNPADNLAGNAKFYEPIRKAIVQAFKVEALTPMKQTGHYAAADNIFKGPANISDVIDDDDLVFLLNDNHEIPMWVANPPQRNQREDRFLESLDIEEWGWSELTENLNWLDDEEADRIKTWISGKDDAWLLNFYALLGDACSNQRQKLDVRNLKLIRTTSEDNDAHLIPSQTFFPATEGITPSTDIYIVKKTVFDAGRSEQNKRLAKLFLEEICGIRPFDTKEQIKLKLAAYSKRPAQIPDEYMSDITMFVEYWKLNPRSNIDLFKNSIFLRGRNTEGKSNWQRAEDLYLDKPFVDTGLRNLFNNPIFRLEKYKSELLKKYHDIPHFADFAVAIGVMDRLEIAEYSATKMQEKEFNISSRKTDTTIDKDYFLNYLEGGWYRDSSQYYIGKLPFKSKNLAISCAIWKTVCRAKPEQLIARYVPNQANSHKEKKTDAYFVKQLANYAWIPDRDGNFLKPADVTKDALHPDFTYDDRNGWLAAIKFGENIKKRSEEYQAKNNKAQEFGFESAERAAKWAELDKLGISPDELLAQQKHPELPEESVPNPERRRKGVLERSENTPSKESISRERSIQPGIANVVAEAKAYLRAKYTNTNGEMVCQCCHHEMPFKIGEYYYFEAVQCFKKIENHHIENRLALCPTCAAMYQYARETDETEIRRLLVEHGAPDDASSLEIPTTLAKKQQILRFVGTHSFDLKTILNDKSQN